MKIKTVSAFKLAKTTVYNYLVSLLAATIITVLLGSLSIAATLLFIPNGILFLSLAMLGLITHIAAFTVGIYQMGSGSRDDAKAPEDQSMNQLITACVVALYISTLLFVGMAVATVIQDFTGYVAIAAFVAIYIPPADVYLIRRTGWSPGSSVIYSSEKTMLLFGIQWSPDQIPILNPERRPMFM